MYLKDFTLNLIFLYSDSVKNLVYVFVSFCKYVFIKDLEEYQISYISPILKILLSRFVIKFLNIRQLNIFVYLFVAIEHCRFTTHGREYIGKQFRSEQGDLCKLWKTASIEQYGITNLDFPEKNFTSAQNFCRNPNGKLNGPWCIIDKTEHKWAYCKIPKCKKGQINMKFFNQKIYYR